MVNTAAGPMNTIADATAVLNGTPNGYTITSDVSGNYQNINFGDTAFFPGDWLLPNGATDGASAGRSFYATRSTANVVIPVGTYTIDAATDDGFRLRIPGVTFFNRINENFTSAPSPSPADTLVFGTGRGAAHTSASFTVSGTPLVTTVTFDEFEGQGGDSFELSAALGAQTT